MTKDSRKRSLPEAIELKGLIDRLVQCKIEAQTAEGRASNAENALERELRRQHKKL